MKSDTRTVSFLAVLGRLRAAARRPTNHTTVPSRIPYQTKSVLPVSAASFQLCDTNCPADEVSSCINVANWFFNDCVDTAEMQWSVSTGECDVAFNSDCYFQSNPSVPVQGNWLVRDCEFLGPMDDDR